MTISAQGVRAVYAGNGGTGPFSLTDPDTNPILFVDNAEIVVTKFSTLGVPSVLTITTHYTLTGAGSATAGSVTLLSALAVGETLVIQRVTPRTQVIDLLVGGKLGNTTIEGFFDKLIRIDQEDREAASRSILLPITYTGDALTFPLPNEPGDDDLMLAYVDGVLEAEPMPAMIRAGAGVPAGGLGNNGDFYINTENFALYGPKTEGSWGVPYSLQGPQGPQGVQGPPGPPGQDGTGTGDVVGPASSVDNRLVAFNGATGKLIKDSGVTIANILTEAEAAAAYQPLDSDLTSIAALTTTSYGRSLLTLANATALAAEVDSFFLTPTEGNAAYQPLDGDLTAIAALTTTSFGRSLLTKADEATFKADVNLEIGVDVAAATVGQGKHSIWIPAQSWYTTGSPSPGILNISGAFFPYLAFDPSAAEFAFASVAMPKSWDEGNLTAMVYWTHPATTTNFGVVWSVSAASFSDDDALTNSYGGAGSIADTGGTTSDMYITGETPAFNPGNTEAEHDYLAMLVFRSPTDGADTMAVDAYLLGVKLFYTTNAATDN